MHISPVTNGSDNVSDSVPSRHQVEGHTQHPDRSDVLHIECAASELPFHILAHLGRNTFTYLIISTLCVNVR